MTTFREVLHAWASKTLAEKSGHIGPFDILDVRVDHIGPSSISSEQLEVTIHFDHGACSADAEYLAKHGYSPCSGRTTWTLFDTTDTVTMLNELLALADT